MKCRLMMTTLLAVGLMSLPVFAQEGKPEKAQDSEKTREALREAKRDSIYDEKADAREQIAEALASAKSENRRVLIKWGANWCIWCHLLHNTFEENREIARKLMYEYDLVLVDIGRFDKNLDLFEKYSVDMKVIQGVPFLTVLDTEGNVLIHQETGSLELPIDKSLPKEKQVLSHDPEKVLAFLTEHQAEYKVADSLLNEQIARANTTDKKVFVHFGAPWCGWCKRLEKWMAQEEVAAVLSKYFVEVKIDTDRTIGGKDILKKMSDGKNGGIPWSAILDSEGGVAAPGFMEGQKNFGYPVSEEEIEGFIAMLTRGSDQITKEDQDFLAESLRKARPKKR